MNKELMEAMTVLEKEYNISKDTLLEAIENSLLTACKNHFGKADNVKVIIDREGCDYSVYAEKEVVENVEDPVTQISLADARMKGAKFDLGDIVQIPIDSHDFGRIATQNAKNVILQKIREESRKSQLNEWQCREKEVVTGNRAALYRTERQCGSWKDRRHPAGIRTGKGRGIPAHGEDQGLYPGGKG